MSTREHRLDPEVQGQIDALKTLMLSGDESPENLREAWRTYLRIKTTTATQAPVDRVAVTHILPM